jgi:peptidoglycan/xylan/chitin deacetylase (PgdA/CDA1 family)
MSPVILTFDDALKGQYHISPDGKTDPDCVVGILEDYHTKHPDWLLKGTFFVLTDGDPKYPPPFYQKEFAQGKMEQLVKDGFEIGNHTLHHRSMNRFNDTQATAEIAGAITGIHKYLPDYNVEEIALPYGRYPKNLKVLKSGKANGISYNNILAMKAAWRPVPCPMNAKFNPYTLERITPGDKFQESHWWLDYLEKNKREKFISDGDPNTYTVNAMAIGQLDKSKIQKNHFHLRTYKEDKIVSTT